MPKRDETLALLAAGLIFFTFIVIGLAWWMPGNAAIYALFSGILSNFSGGLMMYLHLQPAAKPPEPPAPTEKEGPQ